MTTALISMLSNFLSRNLHEVQIFQAELNRAIELYDERPQLLIARKKYNKTIEKKRAKNK